MPLRVFGGITLAMSGILMMLLLFQVEASKGMMCHDHKCFIVTNETYVKTKNVSCRKGWQSLNNTHLTLRMLCLANKSKPTARERSFCSRLNILQIYSYINRENCAAPESASQCQNSAAASQSACASRVSVEVNCTV